MLSPRWHGTCSPIPETFDQPVRERSPRKSHENSIADASHGSDLCTVRLARRAYSGLFGGHLSYRGWLSEWGSVLYFELCYTATGGGGGGRRRFYRTDRSHPRSQPADPSAHHLLVRGADANL